MSTVGLHAVVQHIRTLASSPDTRQRTDQQLLEEFAARQDQAAFAGLVRRHGPLVWGVCRHVLGHEQDAEDAFQAAFLVLARKAGSVHKGEALAGWLHGVAYRTAMKAKRDAARRRYHEARAKSMPPRNPGWDAAWREVQAALDEEIERLPEKYRSVFVLCCLEGHGRGEAARQLGIKEGTVWSRLAQARQQLQRRLARRGITLSAVLGAAALGANANSAGAPAVLADATVRAALLFAAGRTAPTGVISAKVIALVHGVTRAMLLAKLKALAVVLVAGTVIASAGLAAHKALALRQSSEERSDEKRSEPAASAAKAADQPKATAERTGRMDRYGDPLPEGAIARLGTVRWRHGERVKSVAFSPDGKKLASASWDKTVGLWDIATGKRLRTFGGHKAWVNCVVFMPDGKSLISAGDDGIRLWDVDTGRQVRLFEHDGNVWSLALSRDGKTLAAFAATVIGSRINLWDVSSGAKRGELLFEGDQDGLRVLAFSPDGTKLVSCGVRVLRMWEVATKKQLHLFGSGGQTWSLAFSPDGRTLAVGRQDEVVRLYSTATPKEIRGFPGHTYRGRCVVFTSDNKGLITADGDKTVRVWDAATGKLQRQFSVPEFIESLAVSPNGAMLATGTIGSTIHLWDAATGKELKSFGGHQSWLNFAAFADEGKTVLTASFDGSIRLWEAATYKELRPLSVEREYTGTATVSLDSRILALGGSPGIRLVNLQTGKELRKLKGHERQLWGLAFAPKGDVLASIGFLDRSVRLWDVATGKELREIRTAHENGPKCLAYSPDGKLLATGGEFDTTLCLWDAAGGRLLHQWTGHGKSEERYDRGIGIVAFSPDGSLLASSGADKSVRLWDVATSKSRGQLIGYQYGGGPLAFSPDGRMLATAGPDNTVSVWEMASHRERCRFEGHLGAVHHLAFSPDGKRLVSASMDTSALVWAVAGPDLAGRQPQPLAEKELKGLWDDLASPNAARAYRALRTLSVAPKQALPLLQERLLKGSVDDKQVAKWLVDLDSNKFAERENAAEALEKLGETIEPALRKTLRDKASPEVRRRVERLLERLQGPIKSPEALRGLRSIEVLEHIGTLEAQQILKSLAKGAPEARLTQEAIASLERLAKRPGAKP